MKKFIVAYHMPDELMWKTAKSDTKEMEKGNGRIEGLGGKMRGHVCRLWNSIDGGTETFSGRKQSGEQKTGLRIFNITGRRHGRGKGTVAGASSSGLELCLRDRGA